MAARRERRLATWVAAAALGLVGAAEPATADGPPPWQRTETREACSDFARLRAPYFGDTHVHTTYSFDAVSGDVREKPAGAYDFAKGNPIGLPPYDANGNPLRSAQLGRPLDFTAVTDHSEFFGEVSLCLTPGSSAYDTTVCTDYRNAIPQLTQTLSLGIQALPRRYTAVTDPTRFDFCGPTGETCRTQASVIWQETQNAAEAAYDRTAACAFTSFVAYEYTGSPVAQNIHRNVIFRNEVVPALPTSYVEQPTPEGLWAALRAQCLDAGNGCDVLAIPHNSNLSNGLMFTAEDANGDPLITASQAAFRAAMEPLVEVTQHKGDSECRLGVLTNDELCGFENWQSPNIGYVPPPPLVFAPQLFIRNVLKDGLDLEQKIGVNPFRLGMIGSTDTHNATPGAVREDDYQGHLGTRDASPENAVAPIGIGVIGGIESNPGGLAVLWAEENSRDALFAAMRRREAYSTSGTRPIVRFFGGGLNGVRCGGADFVERAYQTGVPMGGELGAVGGDKSPRFAVLALKDPGDPGVPGTPLQRIQIIKGWIDGAGQAQEKVYEVAGDPANGATVDTSTCQTSGPGADELCTVWTDPDFDRTQRAFYYARVVENPVCRWSARLCNAQGVDCAIPASIPPGLAVCCDPQLKKTIQERALTSPIWYRPEAIATLKAKVKFGATAGTDVLRVKATMDRLPASFDSDTQPLTLRLRDDDTIWEVTIPAATLQETRPGTFTYRSDTGALGGLAKLTLVPAKGKLKLKTAPMDLARADRSPHMVEFTLSAGTYETAHSRLWGFKAPTLSSR